MSGYPERKMSENAPSAKAITGIEKNENEIPYGYCQCGCGSLAPIIKRTYGRRELIKGESFRFIAGHQLRHRFGPESSRWNGGISKKPDGRVMVSNKSHPRSDKRGYVRRSHLVAEKALGRFLPISSEVHHADEIPGNDTPSNLVVCEDRAYHMILHQRTRAYKACGIAGWRKCVRCKKYDDPSYMRIRPCDGTFYHNKCQIEYNRKTYEARKNASNN